LYRIGDALYGDGKYEEAASTYQEVISRYPERRELIRDAYLQAASSLERQGKWEEAISLYKILERESSEEDLMAKVRFKVADIYYLRGKGELARREYEEILKRHPKSKVAPDALYRLGLSFEKDGDTSSAILALRRLTKEYPDSIWRGDAHFKAGILLFEEGRYREAIDEFIKIVDLFGDRGDLVAESLSYIGASYEEIGDSKKAQDFYLRVISQYPDTEAAQWARFRQGGIFLAQKDYEKAIAFYKEIVLGGGPRALSARAQYAIGECLAAKGELDDAIVEYLKVGYLYPEEKKWASTGQIQAAQIYERQGKWEEAIKIYEVIIQTHKEGEVVDLSRERIEAIKEEDRTPE
jgi:TolA-binding protein